MVEIETEEEAQKHKLAKQLREAALGYQLPDEYLITKIFGKWVEVPVYLSEEPYGPFPK